MDDDRAGRVASAVALLRELRAEDLAGDPALRELFDAGKALFKRPILQVLTPRVLRTACSRMLAYL